MLKKDIRFFYGRTVLRTVTVRHQEPPLSGFRFTITSSEEGILKTALPRGPFTIVNNESIREFVSADAETIQKAIDILRDHAVATHKKVLEDVRQAAREERAKLAKVRKVLASFR